MELAITKTLSLNLETIKNLIKLSKDTEINMSELVRLFINHFNKNREELKDLIKDGGGK